MNDLISREAAWEEIKKVPLIQPDRMAFKLQQALWDVPAVDAVPVVHGKWLSAYEFAVKCGMPENMMEKNAVKEDIFWKFCSLCDQAVKGFHNYCPNCGAKMDGGK